MHSVLQQFYCSTEVYIHVLGLGATPPFSHALILPFSQPKLLAQMLALARKCWVLMNEQVVGVSRLGPSLANQDALHG